MALAFRAGTTITAVEADNSVTLTMSSAPQSGDWIYCIATLSANSSGVFGTITPPTGFTLLTGATTNYTYGRIDVYRKKSDGTEGTSYTLSGDGSLYAIGLTVFAVSGADGTEPNPGTPVAWQHTSNATVTFPTITTTVDAAWTIATTTTQGNVSGHATDTYSSWSNSYTEIADACVDYAPHGIAWRPQTTAGATGTATVAQDVTDIPLYVIFQIIPGAGGGVTYDNATSSGANSTGVSFSHTTAGSDRALFVFVTTDPGVTVTGAAYNSVSMTSVGSSVNSGNYSCTAFKLSNPAVGANTVAITVSSSSTHRATAISVTGAHQTTASLTSGLLTAENDVDSEPLSFAITSSTGDMVMAGVGGPSDLFPCAAGSGETERSDGTQSYLGLATYTEAGAASVTIDITPNDTFAQYSFIAFNVAAAAANDDTFPQPLPAALGVYRSVRGRIG